jgi:dihydrofolate reductase
MPNGLIRKLPPDCRVYTRWLILPMPIFAIEKHDHFLKTIFMRKLKLQVQMTMDGFVAGPDGELNWMWIPGEPDANNFKKIIELAETSDTILLGRKMTREFVDYWENVVDNQPGSPEQPLAQLMVNTNKIVFSRTETAIKGRNLVVEKRGLVTAIRALKEQPGKDLIVYGGAGFVSSLISNNLIDEYYIFVHPVAIGSGLSIFTGQKVLKLESSVTYKNGNILNKYVPV